MAERRSFVGVGSVAMAVLAAVALAATVLFARRGLAHASDLVMRGEADAVATSIVADLADTEPPPTQAFLASELDRYARRGLRYAAIVNRDGILLEAGTSTMRDAKLRPGEASIGERRVRVANVIPPARPPIFGPPPFPFPAAPPHAHGPGLLVVELEPPVIEQLRAQLTRIAVVAAAAAIALVAFAVALNRYAKRLAAVQRRAAREQRLVALGSMSSVMAHELRNPLAALKGHAQLLVEDLSDRVGEDDDAEAPNPAPQAGDPIDAHAPGGRETARARVLPARDLRKRAERVVEGAQRLEELTTSLLDFVRDGPIDRTPCTAASLAARALADLPADRVDVRTDPDLLMTIDEPRLARAVHNLVDNALQASPEGARVELGVERVGSEVRITVRDHGEGVKDAASIFEPFVTTRVRGTGLGLPIARRIAEQHGGSLSVEGHREGGALFTLRFPIVRAP